MTWSPIETAPRDREIWVCGLAQVWADSCSFAWQGHAIWDENSDGWITGGYDDSGNYLFVEATHWTEPRSLPFPDESPYIEEDENDDY
jgi:hypothetical protein